MIYSQDIHIDLNISINSAKELLKKYTYPYCKNVNSNYDFIGILNGNNFDIILALYGPREVFRTHLIGAFDEKFGKTIFIAKLKPSKQTIMFMALVNVIAIFILLCFLCCNTSNAFVPIILMFVINLFVVVALRFNFNTTKQLLERIYGQ